jgi:hypothetical protein
MSPLPTTPNCSNTAIPPLSLFLEKATKATNNICEPSVRTRRLAKRLVCLWVQS